VVFVPGAAAASPAKVEPAAVDALVRDALRVWEVPGVAVVIVRDGEVVYLKGHGVRELGRHSSVTEDTIFPLASCTKAFTTAAMAILVDEGKMGWDDPVRKHLPSFRLADPLADRDVTLRDLVTHRTGLRGHDLLWYRSPWRQEEIMRRVGLLPLDRPFRTAFQYQSTMFTAAGHAVGAAAATTWADFVNKRLLDPLGMKSTTLTTTDPRNSGRLASPHRVNREGRLDVIPWYPQPEPEPAGSINTTARDLGAWLKLHLSEGTAEGRRIVSAAALRETQTPQIALRLEGIHRDMNPETSQMSYGLGWLLQDYRGYRLVSHAGAIDGFRAQLMLLPDEKIGLALLCNRHQTRMNLALGNSLVDLLLGLPRKDWNGHFRSVVRKEEAATRVQAAERQAKRQHRTTPSRPLPAYAGAYEHPAYGTARVTVEPSGLVLRWSSFTWPLEHYHFDTFSFEDEFLGSLLVTFALDRDGNVASLQASEPLGVKFHKKRHAR
jgi:CubicO group peptidase (beta-lactamase class C family)